MNIFIRIFGSKEAKLAVYRKELDHINFQIRNACGIDCDGMKKLLKQQARLMDLLDIPKDGK